MTFDLLIIVIALGEFGVFWILHVYLFRFLKYENVLKWLVYLYLFTTTVYTFLILMFMNLIIPENLYDLPKQIIIVTTSFTITSLLTGIYIIGIFGIIESSIRIKILSLVAQTKTSGITYKEINKVYNKQIIINKRLLRLLNSGDIRLIEGKYYAPKLVSVFQLITQITRCIDYLHK